MYRMEMAFWYCFSARVCGAVVFTPESGVAGAGVSSPTPTACDWVQEMQVARTRHCGGGGWGMSCVLFAYADRRSPAGTKQQLRAHREQTPSLHAWARPWEGQRDKHV